jgi:AraC-like DNA-binding protein
MSMRTMESAIVAPGASGLPVSRYREFAPPPALAGSVVCTWLQVIGEGATAHDQRVLPDGCIDVIWTGSEPPRVVGPATGPVIVELPPGSALLGVRFRPGCAPPCLGAPASELLDREVPLADLWGRVADSLSQRVLDQPSIAARFAAIEEQVRARLGSARAQDQLAAAAVAWLARHPGGRVERLAGELGVSPRQLQRRFAAAVGYGPKTFQRVARLQRLLALGERSAGARMGLTQLALAAGYADQAHMTREVRALTGRTPAATIGVAGSALAMSGLVEP